MQESLEAMSQAAGSSFAFDERDCHLDEGTSMPEMSRRGLRNRRKQSARNANHPTT